MADPWAVRTTKPAAAAQPAADPWQVVGVKLPPGTVSVGPAQRTLKERFDDNVEEGRRNSITGATADAMAAGLPGPTGEFYKWQNGDEADAYKMRSAADPWYKAPGGLIGKGEAGISTLGGVLAGGLPSPENWLGPGKSWLGRIVLNAGINAAADVPVQALQNQAGTHEGYDPWQTVGAGATGAITQGGFEAAGPVSRAVGSVAGKVARGTGRLIEGALDKFDGSNPIPSRALDEGGWGVANVEPARGAQPAARPTAPAAQPAEGWSVANVKPAAPAPKAAGPAAFGPMADLVRGESARQGVDPDLALSIAQIESPGLNPNAKNPLSSAGGLFQFTDGTWNGMGGGDKFDPALNTQRGIALIRQNSDALTQKLGRPPEPWEVYLAHQQGAGGASAILNGGDVRAADALKAAGVSPKQARASIINNGGSENMTAAQFADLWRQRFSKTGGGTVAPGGEPGPVMTADQAATSVAAPPRAPEVEEPGGFGDFTGRGPAHLADAEAARAGGVRTDDADHLQDVTADLKSGKGGVQSLQAGGEEAFTKQLTESGWKYDPSTRDWTSPAGHSLFVRSQGEHGQPIVQYKPSLGGDNQALSKASGLADFNPIPERAAPRADLPTLPGVKDLTDQALDVLRKGGRVRDSRATLLDWLSQHGVKDEGGELSNAGLDRWHAEKPFRKRVVRPDGRTLEDVAIAAQEVGYLPQKHGDDVDTRAQPQELIDAMREELAGRPRFAHDAPEMDALRAHVQDLDEVLTHLGVDPKAHANEDIKSRIDAFYREPERMGDAQPEAALGVQSGTDRLGMASGKRPEASSFGRVRDQIGRNADLADRRGSLASVVSDLEGQHRGLKLDAHLAHDGKLTLSRVVVPEARRGQGVGTGVMKRLTDFADEHGLTMTLTPSGEFGGSVGRLKEFYGRAGFEPNKGRGRDLSVSESMVRRPGGPSDKLGAIDLSNYQQQIASASASRNIGGLRNAPRPGAVEAGKGQEYSGATVSKLAGRLRQALGITHRQGRLTLKGGAVGEFDPKTSVIRTKAMQEMDVLSHEASHALEYRKKPALMAALAAHADELKKLAYEGANPKHLRQEGFAEFGRWYITNPDHAQKIAPKFYKAFEDALFKDDPDVLRDLKDIQAAYRNMLMSSSVDVAAGSVAYTGGKGGPFTRLTKALDERGLGGAITDLADNAYTAFVDDLHPINKAVRELQDIYAENNGGQRLDLNAAQNPYALARLSREAYAGGHLDLMEGVVPYKGSDPSGPSLAQALEHALGEKAFGKWSKDGLSRFDAYLIARRMVHEWDRYDRGQLTNPPDRNTKEFHQQVIKDSEAANPTWNEAAGLVYDWNTALWKKRYEAGLITKEAHAHGQTTHPDYVPLMRDVSDKGPGGGPRKPAGSMQFSGGAQQFKGSTRDVISPLSSMMREAYELNALVKRNDIIKALDDLAEKAGPGAGRLVERLPRHEVERVNVDAVEALTKAAEASGMSERDMTSLVQAAETALGDATQATLFKQREMNPKKGEAVVFAWRDGKKQPLLLADGEFGQQMFSAISGMDREMSNFLIDSMSAVTQLLRHGVTLSPEFMSRNIVRDQLATWINTDVGYVPGYHFVKGAAEQLKDGQLLHRYQAAGGMRGGAATAALKKPFPKTDKETLAQLQHLRKKGYRIRVYNPLTNPLRGLAALTDLSESGTRLGVMGLAFKQAKKQGLSDYDAMLEAAFTSRDYLDFGRHGSKALTAIRIVAFLNASLQSLDKAARVLTASGNERPTLANFRRVLAPMGAGAPRTPTEKRNLAHAYKAWAKISALAVFGGALRVLYANDPEYEELGDNLRATHWFFKANGQWVGIPKPFELAEPSNIVERALEWKLLKDPKAPDRMWSDAAHVIAPPYDITALSVPFQLAKNRDHMGRPIVPDYLQGTVDPELQFNAYTSELGKFIGRQLHVSPAVVDHVVTGYGGSMGRYLLQGTNLADQALTGKPRTAAGLEDAFISRGFVRDVARGSASQKQFWDLVSKSGGKLIEAEGSFRSYMKAGDDVKATKYLNKLSPTARAYVVAKVFSKDGTSGAHPIVRAQKAVSVLGDLRQEVRDGSLTTMRGQPIALTPSQRRDADNALSHLAMTEMRNALIITGQEGWAQRKVLARQDSMERLAAINPELPALVRQRELEQRVLPVGVTANLWAHMRPMLEQKADPSRLAQIMDAKRLTSSNRGDKRTEVIRQLQGRGVLPPTQAEQRAGAR